MIDEEKINYIYAYLRVDGSPYYIGRGKNNRAFDKHKRTNGINFTPKDPTRIIFLAKSLSKQESFELEKYYIAKYGRKEFGGILINIKEGGDDSGEFTPEMRKKLSASRIGMKLSEEHKRNISIGNKGKKIKKEAIEKAWNSRRANDTDRHSEKTRKLMSDQRIGRFCNGENSSARAVVVFSKDGKFIGDWTNARQACRELGLEKDWKHVPECCSGKRKSVRGFVFRYKDAQSEILAIDPSLVGVEEVED